MDLKEFDNIWMKTYNDSYHNPLTFFQVKPEDYSNPTAIRLAAAVTPGVLMTPFSSILEASNAGKHHYAHLKYST